VALGTTALAAYVVDSFKFSYDFGSNFILGDAVFVSPTDVVLIGVTVGLTTDTVQFYLSEDSGSTWTQVSTSLYLTLTNVPGDIDYADGLVVAAWGGTVFVSTDLGRTWTRTNTFVTETIRKVQVYDSLHCLVLGPPTIQFSSDGGITLNTVTPPALNPAAAINGITFYTNETWFLATSNGQIWQTTDQGATWSPSFVVTNTSWSDVSYEPTLNALLAVGTFPLSGAGAFALSLDGGSTWELSAPQFGASLFNHLTPQVPSATVTPSATPSPSFVPPSPSASPSAHTASPTPSASPSAHTASPTPSASPSSNTASPTPSPSPSPSISVSPTTNQTNTNDDKNTLILGLGIGLGVGGALLVIGGVAAVWYYRRSQSATAYQPINSDV